MSWCNFIFGVNFIFLCFWVWKYMIMIQRKLQYFKSSPSSLLSHLIAQVYFKRVAWLHWCRHLACLWCSYAFALHHVLHYSKFFSGQIKKFCAGSPPSAVEECLKSHLGSVTTKNCRLVSLPLERSQCKINRSICIDRTKSWILEKVVKFVNQFSKLGLSLENKDCQVRKNEICEQVSRPRSEISL